MSNKIIDNLLLKDLILIQYALEKHRNVMQSCIDNVSIFNLSYLGDKPLPTGRTHIQNNYDITNRDLVKSEIKKTEIVLEKIREKILSL